MKKRLMEVFNTNTGKWEDKLMSQQEVDEMKEVEFENFEELKAEFEIIQKSIAMQMGEKTDLKSKD
tara:strand:- start:13256 stop:13453 length:198 start_codon:yes stop_codon:yes gene_type:complete